MRALGPLLVLIVALWVGFYAMAPEAPVIRASHAARPVLVGDGGASAEPRKVTKKASAQAPAPQPSPYGITPAFQVEDQRPPRVKHATYWIPPPDETSGIPHVDGL